MTETARSQGNEWYDEARCENEGYRPDVFFDDIWPEGPKPPGASTIPRAEIAEALQRARLICYRCRVRRLCALTACEEELGSGIRLRYGLRGALTPDQRHSIELRNAIGTLRNPKADPFDFIEGWNPRASSIAVPDRGDGWKDRHTRLARIVAAYLVPLELDTPLPTIGTLSQELGAREVDMRRVLRAFAEDGVLAKTGNPQAWYQYVAFPRHGVVGWVPPHLRATSQNARRGRSL